MSRNRSLFYRRPGTRPPSRGRGMSARNSTERKDDRDSDNHRIPGACESSTSTASSKKIVGAAPAIGEGTL
jgi:hypothetical protein